MDWDDVAKAGLELRGAEASTAYGRPALKVRGKVIACHGKADDHFVLMLDLERVALLMEMEPDIFFQTPHYVGWPCVLLRYDRLARHDLAPLLREAWARRAAKAWLAD
ncbi:MmcQ/YjbR family DNA-binding protein [Sandaracinobacter sp. RS1-74]|uniref:MmcQ/YjbR family DNA-binding protein n=1 Tax=Sandaracinobacteroides sayramensis TaxID=2913411 RepID=UPI001EDB626E|nr:MmcQ/YjbR family DNA-binding protein [Sandaracinobacteroides sayramensis]MCG2840202.1 MmcQ/YjbR family DNA-binding protein [Sandaracinobacteroides sayramensis]